MIISMALEVTRLREKKLYYKKKKIYYDNLRGFGGDASARKKIIFNIISY